MNKKPCHFCGKERTNINNQTNNRRIKRNGQTLPVCRDCKFEKQSKEELDKIRSKNGKKSASKQLDQLERDLRNQMTNQGE